MADVVKKRKSRRLKRSVRRTLGTLFLVSALVVAAIPTDGLGREVQAYDSSAQDTSYESDLTWDKLTTKGQISKVPLVPENCVDIYGDEDGLFYFAWYHDEAVILEYTGHELAGGALTIPDTVDAYAQMSANAGQTTGYVAISRSREVLYYMSLPYSVSTETKSTPTGEKDSNGNDIYATKTVFKEFQLPVFNFCSRDDATWKVDEINTNYLANNFYYRVDNPGEGKYVTEDQLYDTDADGDKILKSDYEAIISSIGVFRGTDGNFYKRSGAETSHQWICNQPVRYIGNQYLVDTNNTSTSADVQVVQTKKVATDGSGKAFVNEDKQHGVFSQRGNITTLTVGNQLVGIGNYAFYECGGLTSIKLGNGLQEIGHDAFAYCDTLYLVDIPYNCNLTHIYDSAFAYSGLNTFALPQPVQYICDSAFEGCSKLVEINLANIDLTYTKQQTFFNETTQQDDASEPRLSQMGCSVFKGCSSLKEITFPTKLSKDIHLDNFQNCSALTRITMLGTLAGFAEHTGTASYTVANFKEEGNVSSEIYFESYGTSKTHDFTKENVIAFKYIDDVQQYEIILLEPGIGGGTVKLTYQVDESNSLYDFEMNGKVSKVEIPTKIGPKYITSISEGSFADTCHLTKIIIPASITSIGANAFKGCHNLRHVIYDDSSTIVSIGGDAFRTQVMLDGHYKASSGGQDCNQSISADLSLSFTGAIATNNGAGNVTGPFNYAMNPSNTISNQNQAATYITYYSGWPTLLEVKYDDKSGKSMLMDYPTIYDLREGKYTDKVASGSTEYKYPFMNEDYVKAVITALQNIYGEDLNGEGGAGSGDDQEMTTSGYATALNNAVRSIVLPYGIESIQDNLFVDKEKNEKSIHPKDSPDGGVTKELTAYGLKEVEDGAFKGFTNLTKVNLADSTIELGSYAFDGCESLTTAVLPMTLEKLGLRPFKDCENLSSVSFSGSPKFTVADDIIYELDADKNKSAVVECLGRRTKSVTKTELAGVRTLYREAFMGSKVLNVDLSSSYISSVPEFAFAYTNGLSTVTLPGTVDYINANAFKNSSIVELFIPSKSTQVDNLALGDGIYKEDDEDAAKDFWKTTHSYASEAAAENAGVGVWTKEADYSYSHTTKSDTSKPTDPANMIIYCEDDSMAKKNFADRYQIETSNDFDKSYVVNFYDEDGVTKLTDTQTVNRNEAATAPDMSGVVKPDGRVFIQWTPPSADPDCIVADTDFVAYFADPTTEFCTITFWRDYTQTEAFGTALVVKGTTRTELEASGQIPTEKVNAYAASISRKFLAWVNMPEVINEDANPYAQYDTLSWTVNFVDRDEPDKIIATQKVLDGENATDFIPTKEGYDFEGWLDSLENITSDRTIRGLFLKSSLTVRHTVTFYNYDGKVYKVLNVPDGEDAAEPAGPAREGYTFTGWQPAANLLKVTRDVDVTATYVAGSGNGSGGNGNGNGGNGNGGNGNGTTSGNTTSGNTASGNGSNGYILTVQNGSGSGSYPAGSQPVIIANNPASGYEFSHWTISPADTPIASTVLSASVITMPASNVTVTANYKVKTGSGSGSGNSSVNNSNRPNGTTGTVTNGGTTVVIDKNGLSNTGVVSAVVNGSSDNFVIKISESSEATEAVLRALVAEYGNDLSNIKYFPMDISLYDSTGTTKITDTTGLRISITLPLPDSLIPYAGNNKVAGVVNDRLDKLSPRFTTIDGVSCVTFTAEHFSPYVIYVDISRLSDGTVADSTPKTGDGIHPKWFLSIGLACLSFVMFMQKDNKKKEKVKVKARA